jgi:hypothetical protein
MNRLLTRTATTFGVLAAAAVLIIGGAGIAHSETEAGGINGCVDRGTGALRILQATDPKVCNSSEFLLQWNSEGPQGPAGPVGATGATGAQGLSGLQVVTADTNPVNWDEQVGTATCPSGKKAISGGAFPILDTGTSGIVNRVAIHVSRPLTLFNTNDSWNVHAFETIPDNFTTWHLRVYAVCAFVS